VAARLQKWRAQGQLGRWRMHEQDGVTAELVGTRAAKKVEDA
jgi:hypothetical protein